MSAKFTIFLSSTVKDFSAVRRDISEWLRARGAEVLESTDPEFPVEPSVHSFDACLAAIQSCHLLILLVGARYGNRHLHSNQSITWREHDEAERLGIPIIKLVLREVNEEAVRAAKLKKSRRKAPDSDVDPRIFDFIDHIRKGVKDNWVHLDWDGSLSAAKKIIDSRFNRLFISYQGKHRKIVEAAERQIEYVAARNTIDKQFAFMHVMQAVSRAPMGDMVNDLLEALVDLRNALFGFQEDDLYNFVIYLKVGQQLKVFARNSDPKIKRHDRSWKIGQGQVGLAAQEQQTLVSPNLRHSGNWQATYRSDKKNYVSAIAVPLVRIAKPIALAGVFVITSNRLDHFRSAEQAEVLTAESIALMLGAIDIFRGQKT